MTPDAFRAALADLHWSIRGVATILDQHETTVRRWANGEAIIPPSVSIWLERLSRFARRNPPPLLSPLSLPENDPALGKTAAGKAFLAQKRNAAQRGIEFHLSFEEWWTWWQTDNRWENRGARRGQYVMARRNDMGPYSLENIYCATPFQNAADRAK